MQTFPQSSPKPPRSVQESFEAAKDAVNNIRNTKLRGQYESILRVYHPIVTGNLQDSQRITEIQSELEKISTDLA
jgi:hypothetical protein